ncbi:unnamed protein product [Lasius platythorax]|uniref:Mutator-like transposase domain-containing protein n=1 Tax=Lasius platythorax TaxID=488582 RepID=A0AAV2MYN1_9HYME
MKTLTPTESSIIWRDVELSNSLFSPNICGVFIVKKLYLWQTERETRRGLASILQVRCHKCLLLNIVNTSKKHSSLDGSMNRFDVNSRIVLGIMHAGMGWTHLNKILSCLNIPTISFSTLKRYEQEIGPLVEKVAKESCVKAAALERNLTIKDAATIEQFLPKDL